MKYSKQSRGLLAATLAVALVIPVLSATSASSAGRDYSKIKNASAGGGLAGLETACKKEGQLNVYKYQSGEFSRQKHLVLSPTALLSLLFLILILGSVAVYSLFFLINFFSLIGMPPLAGFIGKFYLFLSCITVEFFFLFFIAVCSSIFSAVIYLKIIRILFFSKTDYFYFYSVPERIFIVLAALTFKINFLMLLFADDIFKLFYNLNYLF